MSHRDRSRPPHAPPADIRASSSGSQADTPAANAAPPDLATRLHRSLWHHILVYPPLVTAICGLARAWIDPSRRTHAALVRLLDGARAPPPATPQPPSRDQLGAALLAADLDGSLLDAIVADLLRIDVGLVTGLNLRLTHPPPCSRAFHRYSAGVRSRYHALWLARSADEP